MTLKFNESNIYLKYGIIRGGNLKIFICFRKNFKNFDYKPCMKVEGGVGEVKLEILAATPIAETPG